MLYLLVWFIKTEISSPICRREMKKETVFQRLKQNVNLISERREFRYDFEVLICFPFKRYDLIHKT